MSTTHATTAAIGLGALPRWSDFLLRRNGFWVLLVVAASIVLIEVNALTGEIVGANNVTYELAKVIGPTAFLETGAWAEWATGQFGVDGLIRAHILADVAYMVGYGVLLLRLTQPSAIGPVIVAVLLGVDALEDALLWTASMDVAGFSTSFGGALLGVLVAVTEAKWLVTALLLIVMLVDAPLRQRIWRGVRRAFRAAYPHRLPVIVVLAIAVLSLAPGSAVLEQLPDVQRQWMALRAGIWPIVFAVLVYLLVAISLYTIARQRSRAALMRAAVVAGDAPEVPRRAPLRWPWLLVVAGMLVVAGVLELLSPGRFVDWQPLITTGVVILVLVGVSWALSAWPLTRAAVSTDYQRPMDAERARDTVLAGYVVVAAFVSLGFLGLVKSFATPFLLSFSDAFTGSSVESAGQLTAMALIFPFAAAASVLVGPWVLYVIQRREGTRIRKQAAVPNALAQGPYALWADATFPAPSSRVVVLGKTVALVFACLGIGLAFFWPDAIAGLGVVGGTVALVGCWTILLAIVAITLGARRPLEVFALFRRSSDPVLTLLILVPLVASMAGGPAPFHLLRTDPDPAALDRPTLAAAFDEWTERMDCTVPAGDTTITPMLLIAAEGGGIRAATWTTDTLRRLGGDDCLANAPFITSSVSGGSVGAVLMRPERELEASESAADSVETRSTLAVGDPTALAKAVTGLLGRDLLASVTGLRVPTLVDDSSNGGVLQWYDRAATIEAQWESTNEQLQDSFDAEPSPTVGYLVLNSTAAVHHCRVIISQIDFSLTDDGDRPKDNPVGCNDDDRALAGTLDLVDFHPGSCPLELTWGTAAMASARFPIVTPSGRVADVGQEGCEQLRNLQLIDGGYYDNTGLGTLELVAPELADLVADYNADRTEGFVVPIVMYVTNQVSSEATAPPADLQSDLTIPAVSIFEAAAESTLPPTRLVRLSTAFGQVCPEDSAACESALAQVRMDVPDGVAFVAPSTEPSIAVPLGWTLSDPSRSQLEGEVVDQLARFTDGDCAAPISITESRLEFQQFFATYGELMCVLTGTPRR